MDIRWDLRAWLLFVLSVPVAAESRLHLKNRALSLQEDLEEFLTQSPKRRTPGRSRVLIEFRDPPGLEQLFALERRGVRVLGYVPDTGLLVSAPDGVRFEGLEARWAGRLHAPDKLSPLLAGGGAWRCVVQFHPDVSQAEAQALVQEHLLELRHHPDLRSDELLVVGEAARLQQLAEWDEVGYIYPASEQLLAGEPVHACTGALTVWGTLAQYVARGGEGWDGPGRNAADLRYHFAPLARALPREQVQREILRALDEWSRYVELRFWPGDDEWGPRTLRFLFAAGAHGDPFPFDGRGRVLAHAFYPAPPNPEPIAGDVHLDDDEAWRIGDYLDVFSVVLHEIGHALGLGHSDKPGTVMYPYYRKLTGLSAEDIAAIRELYATRERVLTPQPPTQPIPQPPTQPIPQPPVQPTPAPSPPQTPTTPPAQPPTTPTTPSTPSDPQPPSTPKTPSGADTVAPALTITYPASASFLTSSAGITLRGTASDNVGVTQIVWSSSTGASGAAQGTTQWIAGPIPLNLGTNTLIVRAHDAAGNSGWRSVVVTRR